MAVVGLSMLGCGGSSEAPNSVTAAHHLWNGTMVDPDGHSTVFHIDGFHTGSILSGTIALEDAGHFHIGRIHGMVSESEHHFTTDLGGDLGRLQFDGQVTGEVAQGTYAFLSRSTGAGTYSASSCSITFPGTYGFAWQDDYDGTSSSVLIYMSSPTIWEVQPGSQLWQGTGLPFVTSQLYKWQGTIGSDYVNFVLKQQGTANAWFFQVGTEGSGVPTGWLFPFQGTVPAFNGPVTMYCVH